MATRHVFRSETQIAFRPCPPRAERLQAALVRRPPTDTDLRPVPGVKR